ncbi:MAG: [protein-PII] uridylyltransferase [Zoogloeaceae bacterium]|jgi:[protein-PII] uridylyltransferase|nr:[protein-PII] uridylyltransferase [Zoogloeaceae bacterium]
MPSPSSLADLRDTLKNGRAQLAYAWQAKPDDADGYLTSHAMLVDETLAALWQALEMPAEATLAAVGGYGRQELYPHSDVDVLILLPAEPDEATSEKIAQLVGAFWDVGLEAGHSVRTISACLTEAADDISVETALLEARRLTGSPTLFRQFQLAFEAQLDAAAFFEAKRLEQEARHHRWQDSPYSLEPNCKESPGGLRDLQTVLWTTKAAGLGSSWRTLEQDGFLTTDERIQAEAAERYLKRGRITLHLIAHRREDRLIFDLQERMAAARGYTASATRRASEAMMKRYYRNAKTIVQLNTLMLQTLAGRLRPAAKTEPKPINARFQTIGDCLDVVDADLFMRCPEAILESFQIMQHRRHLSGMSARTLRGLWRARDQVDEDFRANPENRARFLSLFQAPRHVWREFTRMNQYSILGRYLPAFGRIVGQMQHDLFHIYTVDQHILAAMAYLRRFAIEQYAHEYPECSRLMADFQRPWTLYVAILFHDIAKGRGGDHAQLGMEDAREFCLAHGIEGEDAELIPWLVGEHLSMSQVAQKADLSDPQVIADFADRVGTPRRLVALYLLTVADIRGTSPKVWNNWKAQLLANLFHATHRVLEAREAGKEIKPVEGVIAERQAEALRLLRYFALAESVHERLWRQLDTVYFLRHSAEEIAWHTRALYYRLSPDKPVVAARPHASGGLQVMVYTRDKPDLFLTLAGFFAREGYSVADAKIHTTTDGYALDTFILLAEDGDIPREVATLIENTLAQALGTEMPAQCPAPRRPSRQMKHFPITPQVSLMADDPRGQSVLTIVAADRPGLLFSIARVLAGHSITLFGARVSTLGERAEDTFLIAGPELSENNRRLKLENDLMETLSSAH